MKSTTAGAGADGLWLATCCFIEKIRKEWLVSQVLEEKKSSACCAPGCCDGTAEAAPRRAEDIVEKVRERYARTAVSGGSCCGTSDVSEETVSRAIGYTADELAAAGDANLGLGCGAPLAHLALQAGETVLDLGSGPGLDACGAADMMAGLAK